MSLRTKKILFAIGFVIVSIGIGLGLWYVFFRPLIAPPSETPPTSLPGELPTANVGSPTIPTEEANLGTLGTSPTETG
ncbi:MAG: hypothetical protein NUV81_04185, partial [bacterium]|nr:hypothetical protein [bacterium]